MKHSLCVHRNICAAGEEFDTHAVISGYLNQLTSLFFSILRLNFWFHHRFQLNINKTFVCNDFSLERWSTQIQFRWFCFRFLIDFFFVFHFFCEKLNCIDVKSHSSFDIRLESWNACVCVGGCVCVCMYYIIYTCIMCGMVFVECGRSATVKIQTLKIQLYVHGILGN